MKLTLGEGQTTYGTIEDTPHGLVLAGDQAALTRLVDMVLDGARPQDAPGGLPGFMRWLARQTNNGYLWNHVDDAGTPPPLDWRSDAAIRAADRRSGRPGFWA